MFSSVVFCPVGNSIFVFQHSRRSSAHGTLTKLGKMKRKCVLESIKMLIDVIISPVVRMVKRVGETITYSPSPVFLSSWCV